MTAAGPFMKFIEVIGRLHSVRESAGWSWLRTRATRLCSSALKPSVLRVSRSLSSFLSPTSFQPTVDTWKPGWRACLPGQLSARLVFDLASRRADGCNFFARARLVCASCSQAAWIFKRFFFLGPCLTLDSCYKPCYGKWFLKIGWLHVFQGISVHIIFGKVKKGEVTSTKVQ